jgi:hypothetical protein
MDSDRARIKIINGAFAGSASLALETGAELVVDSATANALIVSGAAIRVSVQSRDHA